MVGGRGGGGGSSWGGIFPGGGGGGGGGGGVLLGEESFQVERNEKIFGWWGYPIPPRVRETLNLRGFEFKGFVLVNFHSRS